MITKKIKKELDDKNDDNQEDKINEDN